MFMHSCWSPEKWNWMLSNDFGVLVFSMFFITWTLLIITLFLLSVYLGRKVFGDTLNRFRKKK